MGRQLRHHSGTKIILALGVSAYFPGHLLKLQTVFWLALVPGGFTDPDHAARLMTAKIMDSQRSKLRGSLSIIFRYPLHALTGEETRGRQGKGLSQGVHTSDSQCQSSGVMFAIFS